MLKNLIPAKYRQLAYAVVSLASAVVAIPGVIPVSVPAPVAAKIIAALASLTSLLAAGNVDKTV